MVSELTQVERHERAIGILTHAEGSARVQDEQGGTIWSDPTENLDIAHRAVAPEPVNARVRGPRSSGRSQALLGAAGRANS